MAETPYSREAMMSTGPLKAPFPWFGGKTLAAPLIWQRLGNVTNYVEPFMGSLAVLLNRPHVPNIETVNDKDGFVCNAWRALAADPDEVARWCDKPVNECDQHAVHTWLLAQRETLTTRLMGDPDYYDAQVAGRWIYGICCWIGSGWCSGDGPWQSIDGHLVHTGENGVKRQLVHLGTAGQGVHRQRVHLGQQGGGMGVHARHARGDRLYEWFAALQARLRYVRVCCGDWRRVMGPSVTLMHGLTGILLDPPYSAEEERDAGIYAVDDLKIAHDVRAWCLANGDHPLLRIVLCGYGDSHDELLEHGWRKVTWKANGGFGNQGNGQGRFNATQETLWCSPACLSTTQEQQLDLWSPCV